MIYLPTREILQNMDIFKENSHKLHLTVTLKCNIFLPNFSYKHDKLNKHTWKMYIKI